MDYQAFFAAVDRHAPEAYSFSNPPVEVSEADLKSALADLRREAKRIPALVSLYVDDSGFAVGPRSMRLIAVYDATKCEPGSMRAHDLLRTVGTRNIFESAVLPLDVKLMEALPKFECLLAPKHIAGREIATPTVQPSELRFYYLSRLLDLFASRWLQPFVEAEVLRRVDTRSAIVALQRLCRVISVAKVIMRRDQESTPQWDDFARDVRRLQDVWFRAGIERYKGIISLLRQALAIAFGLIDALNAYCLKARVVNLSLEAGASAPQALLTTKGGATAFVDPWTPERGLELTLRATKALDRHVSVLPAAFALQLYEYSKGKNAFATFSRYIQSVFGVDGLSGNLERSYISWERGEQIDRFQSFLNRIGAPSDHGLAFACNVRSGSPISAAASFFNSHRNSARLKSDMKTIKNVLAAYLAGRPLEPACIG